MLFQPEFDKLSENLKYLKKISLKIDIRLFLSEVKVYKHRIEQIYTYFYQ